MEQRRVKAGLALGPYALMSAKGKIKEEVLNTLVRQSRKLMETGYDVFILLLNASRYCEQEAFGENLRLSLGKKRIAQICSDAFLRRNMTICLLDSDVATAKATMREAFAQGIVPVAVGKYPDCADEAYFVDFCEGVHADIRVVVGSGRDDSSLLLAQNRQLRLVNHYESNFFLKAVEQEDWKDHWMLE